MIKCYLYLRAVFKKKDVVLINQRAVWEMHMIRVILCPGGSNEQCLVHAEPRRHCLFKG